MRWFASFILRWKAILFTIVIAITVFMLFQLPKLEIDYGVPNFLSKNNEAYQDYEYFKSVFGKEKQLYIIGIEKNPLNDSELYKHWKSLGDNFNKLWGVDSVVSVAHGLFYFQKDTTDKKLIIKDLAKNLTSAKELKAANELLSNLPFYKDRIINSNGSNLMLVELKNDVFNSKHRDEVVKPIFRNIEEFETKTGVKIHISGLPYIKTIMRELIKNDFFKFILMAFVICFGMIFLIFRSPAPALASCIVVIIGLVWCLGSIVLLGSKINVLTGVVPTLVIVIGIPNCIYLINYFIKKYEIAKDKVDALNKTIREVGLATLLTNLTTSIGFFAFYITDSDGLKEFGRIAGLNVLFLFIISIITIPFILSVYPIKRKFQDKKQKIWLTNFLNWISLSVQNNRPKIYFVASFLILFSAVGITRIKVSGNLTDDLPNNHSIFSDISWFENNFGGIIPLELYINTKKENRATNYRFLKKIQTLSDSLASIPQISEPISVGEIIKHAKQGYYNNDPTFYQPIISNERLFIYPYLQLKGGSGNSNQLSSYLDSNKQVTRISYLMKDLPSEEMDKLSIKVKEVVNHVFEGDEYETSLTGSSIVFLRGTEFLTKNLAQSITLAICIIGLLMAFLFKSAKMIFNALITNLIPLVLTLGFMGWVGINIKPSTILVFSIAFGIAVDDTIHFLAKYRIAMTNSPNKQANIISTIKDVGASMFFTSIVLFLGFIVFVFSGFEGTKALGILLSFSLLTAMLANLIFLPALLYPKNKETKKS